jgi:hypothetical protein
MCGAKQMALEHDDDDDNPADPQRSLYAERGDMLSRRRRDERRLDPGS